MFTFPSIPTACQENPIKLGMGRICPVGYLNKRFFEKNPHCSLYTERSTQSLWNELSAKLETSTSIHALYLTVAVATPCGLVSSRNVENTNEQLNVEHRSCLSIPIDTRSYWLQIKQSVSTLQSTEREKYDPQTQVLILQSHLWKEAFQGSP